MEERQKKPIEEIRGGRGGLRRLLPTGFTLIELLVVIAITALAASIALPVLNQVQTQFTGVGCTSNLHQLGQMWVMYTNENNDQFMERGSGYGFGAVSWFHCIRDYYWPNEELLFCPLAEETQAEGGRNPHMAWENTTDFGAHYKGSYGINLWVSSGASAEVVSAAGPHFNSWCWGTPSVDGASDVPVLVCSQWKDIQPYPVDEPLEFESDVWTPGPADEMRRPCIKRHAPYNVQVLWLDFSVSERTIKQLWRLKWHREWPAADPLPVWPEWMADVPEPD